MGLNTCSPYGEKQSRCPHRRDCLVARRRSPYGERLPRNDTEGFSWVLLSLTAPLLPASPKKSRSGYNGSYSPAFSLLPSAFRLHSSSSQRTSADVRRWTSSPDATGPPTRRVRSGSSLMAKYVIVYSPACGGATWTPSQRLAVAVRVARRPVVKGAEIANLVALTASHGECEERSVGQGLRLADNRTPDIVPPPATRMTLSPLFAACQSRAVPSQLPVRTVRV